MSLGNLDTGQIFTLTKNIQQFFHVAVFAVMYDGQYWEVGFGNHVEYEGFYFLENRFGKSLILDEAIEMFLSNINGLGAILDRLIENHAPVEEITSGEYTGFNLIDTGLIAFQLFHVGETHHGNLLGYGKDGDQLYVIDRVDGTRNMYITNRIESAELKRMGITNIKGDI